MLREIAEQHGQPTILTVGVGEVADAALLAVQIQAVPPPGLAEGHLGRYSPGGGQVALPCRFTRRADNIPVVQGRGEGRAMNGRDPAVDQAGTIQFTKNTEDATRTMDIFHVILLGSRGDLTQVRNASTQPVDVSHAKLNASLMGCGQQVQDRVGRPPHGDIQGHGVLERQTTGDDTREYLIVIFLVPAPGQGDDQPSRFKEEFPAGGVGRQ